MKPLFTALSVSLIFSLSLVFAHSEFESSTPEDGAVLDVVPTEIVINFDKDIQPAFSIFKVYPLPADMIAEAATAAESEHSEEHSEGEHSESETHSEGDVHGEESSEHSEMDEAAKLFIPTVIDLSGDEDARADMGLAATEDLAKSVTITLKEDLAPGAYVAMFRVLSGDTHIVEGFITFEIAE
jgi:copper resistance protein C